jgi:hypothetical protein
VNRRIALIPFLVLIAVSAWAQMGGQPGPELKKLDYFVGTWTTEGTIAQGPWGTGGKFSATGTSEWMPGNFFLQSHSEVKMPPEVGGETKDLTVMGFDTQQNVYTHDAFGSQGRHESSKGTLAGDTWTWNSSANYGGMDIQQKMTIKTLTPTSYSVKFEISMDGKTWMPFMEGKATKK